MTNGVLIRSAVEADAAVIAQLAKEMGILTVAVVSRPFMFEGKRRADVADSGIEELTEHVDSLITISNQKLLEVDDVPITSAFSMANEVLQGAVQGIAELITRQGLINVDFADVTTVMQEMGKAMMGSGSASGSTDSCCVCSPCAAGRAASVSKKRSSAVGSHRQFCTTLKSP